MTYKDRMRTLFPQGEIKLFRRFELAGLSRGLVTQKTIPLVDTEADPPREFEAKPDYWWTLDDLVGFLDGPHHLSRRVTDRDEKIVRYLWAQKGIRALRWSYTPPLSDRRCAEIVDMVRPILKRGKTDG
jgi:hypothetical protein